MTDAATEELYACLALLPEEDLRDMQRQQPGDPLGNGNEVEDAPPDDERSMP